MLATGLGIVLFHSLPNSAWAGGTLAEGAEQVGKMGEYPKSKSTQPSRQTDTPLCTVQINLYVPKRHLKQNAFSGV